MHRRSVNVDDTTRSLGLGISYPCAGCGYDLRGLPESNRCPECDAPVSLALRGERLEFASRGWVRRLLLGVRLKLATVGVAIVGAMILVAIDSRNASYAITVGCAVVGPILWMLGTFAITSPEPRLSLVEARIRLRTFVRVSATVVFFGPLPYRLLWGASVTRFVALTGIFLAIFMTIALLAELVYVRRLVGRLSNSGLRDPMSGVIVAVVLSGVLAIMGDTMGFWALTQSKAGTVSAAIAPMNPWSASLGGVLKGIASVIWALFVLGYSAILFQFARALGPITAEMGNSPGCGKTSL